MSEALECPVCLTLPEGEGAVLGPRLEHAPSTDSAHTVHACSLHPRTTRRASCLVVHQCNEGHCYCVDCWIRLAPRRCPECRQPLPQANRNRAAERAIAALKHHVVVAYECTADGPGLTGKWAAPVCSSFTITARGRGGQQLCSGGATFRVKVRGQGIVEPEVRDLQDGTYQVELTYPISGKYEVLVSLDRTKMPIKGSPFAVTVLPARRLAPRYDVPAGWPPPPPAALPRALPLALPRALPLPRKLPRELPLALPRALPLPLALPPALSLALPLQSLEPPLEPLLEGEATGRNCDGGAAQGAAPHTISFDEVMARMELQVATTECEELRAQNQQLHLQCDSLQQQVAVVCHDLQQVHRQLRLMAGRVWRGP